jgi:hypothetical protein
MRIDGLTLRKVSRASSRRYRQRLVHASEAAYDAQPEVGWCFRHSCIVRSALASIMTPNMNAIFTAVVKQRGDWWIGWIEDVPGVNA